MRALLEKISRFCDCRGSITVPAAIFLPLLVLLIGGTLDYADAVSQRQRLQSTVDKAALAAARELGLSDARRENVQAVVEAMVLSALGANADRRPPPDVRTSVSDDPLEVTVTAHQRTRPYFGGAFGMAPLVLEVETVARVIGRPNICILGLDPSANGTISLEQNARVTGQNCAVFSNSTHNNGIKAKNSAVLSASMICSAGGKAGGKGNFTPEPLSDCPTFDDPLSGRPEPAIGPCDDALPTKVTSARPLAPGTYCGGLTLEAGAVVTLQPGIYVIKDGALRVRDGASLAGTDVGIFFTGAGAVLAFERLSTISLGAPTFGPMAGILVFESRAASLNGVHEILSDDARNLLGTLYLSRGRLNVDATRPIADQSAYTAIVARMLTLFGGPHLVLNTNYALTSVPVPHGIRGADQPVSLVK